MRFAVQLKPRDRPVTLPDELLHEQLAGEVHVRYLESIGAAPSKSNLAIVRTELPLSGCNFMTAWKSRGGNADAVYVSPPAAAQPGLGARRGPSFKPPRRPAQPDELDSSDEIKSEAGSEGGSEANRKRFSQRDPYDLVPKGAMSFSDAQLKFLYPFKAQGEDAYPSKGSRSDRDPCAPRAISLYDRYTPEELQEELAQALSISTKSIVSLQAEFTHSFPFEQLEGRLSEQEMRTALREISCKRTTRFIGLVALLLYWTHIAPKSAKSAEDGQTSVLYCAVQHYFSSARDSLRPRRAALLYILPLLLLLVRMSVETIYRRAFPKWWTTVDGEETLREMDADLEQIFDPGHQLSQISSLGTAGAAARAARAKARRRHDEGWYTTSAHVAAALPRSHYVRRQEPPGGRSSSGPLPAVGLKREMPREMREALYSEALARAEARQHRHASAESPPGEQGRGLAKSQSLKDLVRPQAPRPSR